MARTLDQLAIIANQIKDATLQGENTADRVGGLLVDLIDFLRTINVDEIALSPLLTALNESGLVDPQDGQILKFKSSEDNWVFSSDITQITATIRTILDTLGHLDNEFVKKTGDIMTGLLTTLAGIKVRNFLQLGDRFVSGLLGEGAIFRENVGGRTYLEADEMYIRVKAYFDTVEIRKFLHSGGNRIASLGGAKCIRVEMLNSNNEVVTEAPAKYRCYFRASDGDDTITNDFVVGDQAYCHVTNATNNSLSMHHYWRLVIGKNELPNENGEHWIDLSNQESETIDGIVYSGYLNISDAPAAQDDIIQLGNVNDSTRRGAIIEFVSGNDAPAYQIFQDLGSIGTATTIAQKHDAQYSYNGKNYISLGYNSSTGRAFMNVYGDFLFGDPEESTYVKYNAFTKQLDIKATVHFISPTTHQETTLDTFASAVTGGLENIQRQIDGEIDTWFYNGTPGPSVLPESEWVAIDTQTGSNNERLKHLGDLYYDNSTGYAYRYTNTGSEASPVFTWSQISDSAVIKALEDAAKAQDTADHKRRVFVTSAGVLPTPPYSEGDLWMNVTYPANATSTDAANNIYYNDILRCKVPATYNQQGELVREGVESGETALITHWQLSSKYTDDSKFNYFFTNTYSPFVTNIQQQVDRKAETWRQDDDPSLTQDWVPSEHVGDLWMDTNDTDQYGHKTFIYVDHGEGTNPRYSWEPQAVPDEVFDKIDGKAEIFVQKPTTYNERDMWIIESGLASTDMPSGCQAGDIVVADNMPSGITKRENSYVKGDWRKKDRYTDDTKVNNLLNNTYVQQLIGGSINQAIIDGDAAAVQQAAQAAQTTYGYLTQALSQDTQITGGLILSSMIALRDSNGNMRSGISGTYIDRTTPNPEDPDEPYALGHGIAAWYGGENIDHEAFPALTNYAKSLFRFDGTGYLASGNISWDIDGALTIQGVTFRAVEGSSVIEITPAQIASINWVNSNFISKAWFNKFFVAHYKRNNTDYTLAPNNDFPNDATDKTLESVFSFWTNYAISALGQGVDGSHAIGVLDDLNDVTITNPTANQVLSYNGTHWVNRSIELGSQTLADLTDVVITSPAANQMLGYDAATQKWKNIAIPATGVTSVALSMPTGFSITGSPITSSGTFTVTFTSGYSLPTTAKQSNWDTAYSWGNHASAGYALAANLGTASSHAHSDYLTSLSWDSTNKKLAWAKGGTAQTAITIGYASVAGSANSVAWSAVTGTPTTLGNYGITDAKIVDGVITLGASSITPVTSVAMSVPIGFSVSGSPISKTGTLAVSYASGYEGFTTELKNKINMLFSWFEVDNDGNIKTKDYTDGGTTKHRGFYSPSFISALGQGDDGTAGVGDVTWALLADNTDNRQIALSHLSAGLTTLTGYTTSGKNYAVQKDANNHLYVNVPWEAGSGTVSSIKVGTTTYNPSSGVVSLPAYPTTLPASDVYSWAKAVNKPAYTYSEVGAASSTHTHATSIATSSGNNQITLAFGTKYAITAGGTSYIFTMPSNPNTNTTYKFTIGSTTRGDSTNGVDLGTLKSETAAASGTTLSLVTTGEKAVWNAKSNLAIGTTATTAAAGNHTHTLSIAADSGTNQFTLAHNTKYKLTAGGSTLIFTTPADSNSWRNIYTGGTSRIGTGIDTKAINFVGVNGIAVSFLAAGTGTGQSGNANYFSIKLDGSHTHATSIAADSGTNELTLAFGTKYKLTAGGTSFVFTMPSNPDTDVNVKVNNTNPTTGTWYYPVWYTATSGTGNVNANDGFRYYSLQGTASALGESYLQIGNSTASGTAGNKRGHLRIYGNKAYYGEFSMIDNLSENKTYTFDTAGTILTSGNSSVSLSGQTLTVKINGVSKSLTNSTYTLAGLMGSTAKGSTTQPIYWNGTAFANTTYTLGKSVPSDAVFTDHYAWSDITGKPLTLTKNTTGFSISGGTTSKTLTVGADYTLGAACAKGVTDNSSNADVTSSDTNLITGRTLYYQLAKKGYTTNTGTVTSVATGTGLTGGTITTSGTISINSTYQTYISHGESAYNSLGNYLPKSGGTVNNTFNVSAYGITVSFAPQNDEWAHIYSDKDVPFIFNNDVFTIGGLFPYLTAYDIGSTSFRWGGVYCTNVNASNTVKIGDAYLSYDSTNNAIRVSKNADGTGAANFYATGGVSALGAGQESGGGGSYLPLSGGTMNGTISFNSDIAGGNIRFKEGEHFDGWGNFYFSNSSTEWNIYSANNNKKFSVTNNGSDVVRLYSETSYVGIYFNRSTTSWSMSATTDGYFAWWNNYSEDFLIKFYRNGNIYATGYNNTSDIRKKNVIKDVDLRLDQIAKAPAFEYYWLDPSIDHDLHVGTSAQYWESVLPQVVTTAKDEIGTKSLQYGVAALISAITVARKVMTHEEKIALLETRVSALEKENGEQEQLINSLQEELAKFKAA